MTASAPASAQDQETALVERAAALHDLVAEDAAEADRERRLTDRVVDAITDAGLLSLTTPRRLGGYEADLATLVEVTRELGRACSSTGWVAGILNAGAWLAATLPEQAQREVWGENPHARVAGVLAPTAEVEHVDGGIVVTGEWGWASGSLHAEWTMAGAPLGTDADGRPENALILLPMSELTIKDTWFVAGMRGTGSNTLVAERVFVPEHRIMSMAAALDGEYRTEHADEALYRASLPGVLMLAALGPHVGMAQAVLEYATAKAPRRSVSSTTYTAQTDSVAFQLRLAEAAIKIDSALMHAHRAAADVQSAAEAGGLPEPLIRARVRMDSGWVSTLCREAIDDLMTAHGSSGFADFSPIARIWRDQETSSRHAILQTDVCKEVYGKALLGVEPNVSHLI
ncbi:MAG: oxidoreductase [Solirubrobacterales bacterium]|nr:oxidoreductase [Solirubrobacterales bacterium]